MLSSGPDGVEFESVAGLSPFGTQVVQPAALAGLDNNLNVVDLSDLVADLPLTVDSTTQILEVTEAWENDTLGFPTLVKNDRGQNPDNKYYLYYAHHDPGSGIGAAMADSLTGPYTKISSPDSRVLIPSGGSANQHYSTPSVVWNEDTGLWNMYFHFWNSDHFPWRNTMGQGFGHQMTALATSPDLKANVWTTVPGDPAVLNPAFEPVLPTTAARWMNSESSYHGIQRLPNGTWLAFLRGRGAELDPTQPGGLRSDNTKIGFATSDDGQNWTYRPQNPILHEGDGGGGPIGHYAPEFVGYLGKNGAGEDEYLLVWNESGNIKYGKTTDFVSIQRDPRGYANWPSYGGADTAWREGNRLYIFTGKFVHEMILPVSSQPPTTLPYFEDFDDSSADSLEPQLGQWVINSSLRYKATPVSGENAVSLVRLIDPLPGSVELKATIRAKDVNGFNKNGLLIYDFQNAGNFKFAGFFAAAGEWRIGRWINGGLDIKAQAADTINLETDYDVEVQIRDKKATLLVGGVEKLSYEFWASVVDGDVGVGTRNAVAVFDDLVVRVPGAALPYFEDFEDGIADALSSVSGTWVINGANRYKATPASGENPVSLVELVDPLPASVELKATIRSKDVSGFAKNGLLIYDFQNAGNFKFAGLFAGAGEWRIGRWINGALDIKARAADTINLETDYEVAVQLNDRTATLLVGGVEKLSHEFWASVVDGDVGVGTRDAVTVFDDLVIGDAPPTPASLPYAEYFDDTAADAFTAVTGSWWVNGVGRYRTAPDVGSDAVTVLDLGSALPDHTIIDLILRGTDGGADFFVNALVIFDYESPTNFKFAGAFVGSGTWRIGHVNGTTWTMDATIGASLSAEIDYHVQVKLLGTVAVVSVEGIDKIQYDFSASLADGRVGLGTRRSYAAFDDVTVSDPSAPVAPAVITVTPQDDLVTAIESAPNNAVVKLTAGTFNLAAHGPFNQGVLINNKRNLTITGEGDQTIIQLASNAHFGFYIGSNNEHMTIRDLFIKGAPPLSVNTHAIGNFSGSTNNRYVRYTSLRIEDVAVGISAATSTSGVYEHVAITDNVIRRTIGTEGGWGYGIHMENAKNVLIARNRIEQGTRHSIYIARAAAGSNVTVEHNQIIDHDLHFQQSRFYAAALAVARSSDVKIAHNVLTNPRTIGISIEPDESLGWATTDITLLDNKVIGAYYVGIWVVSGQTHTALGNVIEPQPVNLTPNADWHAPVSFIDFARGVNTTSALAPPRPRWSNADFVVELEGLIYVLKGSVLDRITPYSWDYTTSPTNWTGTTQITAIPDPGLNGGRLRITRGGVVYELNPDTWAFHAV